MFYLHTIKNYFDWIFYFHLCVWCCIDKVTEEHEKKWKVYKNTALKMLFDDNKVPL